MMTNSEKHETGVELKLRIQREIAEENAGLSPEEQSAHRTKLLAESQHPLARWWRGEKVEVAPEHRIENLLREARARHAERLPKEFDCVEMKRQIQAELLETDPKNLIAREESSQYDT